MTLPKPNVLVVDDNPANLLARELVLEKDYDVALASSGPQAIDMSEREDFAVILLDVRMPVMDGFQTAVELRRRGRTRFTPIIFTSAVDTTQSHVNLGFALGATDYLLDPVDSDFLKFKVTAYCQTFLRDQALRERIDQLKDLVRIFRAELDKAYPKEGALRARIVDLESAIEKLRRPTLAGV